MRYLWILFIPMLMGFTQIYNTHDTFKKVDDEVKNISDNLQSRQFTVVYSTPNYQDLQDGEIVIYSSSTINPTVNLQLRLGTTIYASPFFSIPRGR